MRKILIITGLTASGKSGLAVELARKFNGEIISADSVQIYRGLNIGSAKEDEKIMNEIPHHLINIKNFDESYNVGEFLTDCEHAINNVISRSKLPIIVGGTAMYIKALMEGFSLGETSADLEFRAKYQEMAKTQGNLAVWNELNNINSELANSVHPNNVKRVIRYLEIATHEQTPTKQESILKDYDVLCIGVVSDRELIYNRINTRVDEMLKMGLYEEIQGLIAKGAKREMQAFNSIGYKEWFDHFEGKTDKSQVVELIKQHTRNYCKRQLTFLKTIKNITLCDVREAEKIATKFLEDKND